MNGVNSSNGVVSCFCCPSLSPGAPQKRSVPACQGHWGLIPSVPQFLGNDMYRGRTRAIGGEGLSPAVFRHVLHSACSGLLSLSLCWSLWDESSFSPAPPPRGRSEETEAERGKTAYKATLLRLVRVNKLVPRLNPPPPTLLSTALRTTVI